MLLVVVAASIAPLPTPYGPIDSSIPARFLPRSATHWFGTGQYDRDVFSRVLCGSSYDLLIAALAVAAGVGTPLGMLAGCFRGWTDNVIMRVLDLLLAFPNLLLSMTLAMGFAILLAVGLGFIGLGAPTPTPEWGVMINEGRNQVILGRWWTPVFAGLTIVLPVTTFKLLGDRLREALRTRLSWPRRRRLRDRLPPPPFGLGQPMAEAEARGGEVERCRQGPST